MKMHPSWKPIKYLKGNLVSEALYEMPDEWAEKWENIALEAARENTHLIVIACPPDFNMDWMKVGGMIDEFLQERFDSPAPPPAAGA